MYSSWYACSLMTEWQQLGVLDGPQVTSRRGELRESPLPQKIPPAIFMIGGVGDNRHERLV